MTHHPIGRPISVALSEKPDGRWIVTATYANDVERAVFEGHAARHRAVSHMVLAYGEYPE